MRKKQGTKIYLSYTKVTSLYQVAPYVATYKCLLLQSSGKWFHVVWYTSS